jgi:hypothetical protein
MGKARSQKERKGFSKVSKLFIKVETNMKIINT